MDYNNKDEHYYTNVRHEMADLLPQNSKTVLDVGCSEGMFGSFLKNNHNIEVWGIEMMTDAGEVAKNKLDKVFIGPCENHLDSLPENYFDAIYFNDVLEHLIDPYLVLEKIKPKLTKNGVIISSIPNLRYHKVLKDLVLYKNFDYTMDGVLDKTHLRFFTTKSIVKMYKKLDFEIVIHKGINKTKSIKPYIYNIPFLFTAMDIFYIQYATVVKKK